MMERGFNLQASGCRTCRTRTRFRALAALPLLFASMTACIGTTGSDVVSFKAYAAGLASLPPETGAQGLSFANSRGWSITLTRAKLHIGAVYLNRSVPISGAQSGVCFLPGVYVAQVLSGVTIDALSPALQPFPEPGSGTADYAATGEVWLTGDRVDSTDDPTVIAEVAGTAARGDETMRFEGTITISSNRATSSTEPSRPGANPLCAQRIVTNIPIAITPTNGGALVVRVDPRVWFANVDLGELAPVSPGSDLRRIPDDSVGEAARNLYGGLRGASAGAYRFEWVP